LIFGVRATTSGRCTRKLARHSEKSKIMPDTPATAVAPLSNRPDTLDFLLTRRSRPPKTLGTPVPDRAELVPASEGRRPGA
jgi:hypothetical protein